MATTVEDKQEIIADWLVANLPLLDEHLVASRTDYATVHVNLPGSISFSLKVSVYDEED